MEPILIKLFAVALALSQVTARPDNVKTEFDPVKDQAEVTQLLETGCTHLKRAFDIDNIDLDGLIETVMEDSRGGNEEAKAFRGLKFGDLHLAYRQVCKRERAATPVVNTTELIEFYNRTAAGLPDHNRLKGLKMPGLTAVADRSGAAYAELFQPENRRVWVPLADIPKHVQQAFVAAEDKRFYEHKGVDERSVIRAFIANIADPNKRQGGSTITQQVAKNLLVGDDVTYERKIREIVTASRIEKAISKDEILEIYLNAIFLGRGSWGIEMAARSYFGKAAKDLTIGEGAFLAGLTKGPNYYNPDRRRDRANERLAYVLGRMAEDGFISEDVSKAERTRGLVLVAGNRPRRDNGFHFVEHLRREAKTVAGIESLTESSYKIRSTINPALQVAAETAVQDALARYEQTVGRVSFSGPEANLATTIQKIAADPARDRSKTPWQQALERARPPLYDVHWTPAVVVEKSRAQGGAESIRVGLRDGRVFPLSTVSTNSRRLLSLHDLVYVRVTENQKSARVELRARPQVQASAVVLENSTGRILAMVGGFSFPVSQLNRATQSRRQPGSAFKPLTFLAALNAGLQPNTLLQDSPITLPPIGVRGRYTSDKDWWSPKNYDGGYSGSATLRRGLEMSKNLVTAHLLDGAISSDPADSLDKVCQIAVQGGLYGKCERFYPFVLGAQPVRVLDMAAFYAGIANEGARPTPYAIEQIEQRDRVLYQAKPQLTQISAADKPSFVQLKSILQGVLARGTAARAAHLAPFAAGKTGTSDEENDAWFAGFSNDVTIAVWVGYDNARGKRTLGSQGTGTRLALPIFESIMQASWTTHAAKTPLRGPSPEAARQLLAMPIDVRSGERVASAGRGAGGFMEYFRTDGSGRIAETQYRFVSRSEPLEGWDDSDRDGGSRSYRSDNPFGFRSYEPPQQDPYERNPNYNRRRDVDGMPFYDPVRPPSDVPQQQQQQRQRTADPRYQQQQPQQRRPSPFPFDFFGDDRPQPQPRRYESGASPRRF